MNTETAERRPTSARLIGAAMPRYQELRQQGMGIIDAALQANDDYHRCVEYRRCAECGGPNATVRLGGNEYICVDCVPAEAKQPYQRDPRGAWEF